MMYKIKKESMLWNEFLGSQSFEFIKPYFRNLGARNILITDIWEGEFEPIEEKEYTHDTMSILIELVRYLHNLPDLVYGKEAQHILVMQIVKDFLKQRK